MQPDPVAQGLPLTVEAHDVVDPDGEVSSVSVYWDVDANCRLEACDVYLGYDEDPSDGWSIEVDTSSLPLGDLHVIARAKDDSGAWSLPACASAMIDDPPCTGDTNADGVVDVADLLALLAAWGGAGGPEDINGDGIVDVQDLLTLLSAWGPC
jgi:hypothetical protein